MDEALRHEIVQRHQGGASVRSIAKELGVSRGAVVRALARVQAQRAGGPRRHKSLRHLPVPPASSTAASPLPPPPTTMTSN